MGLLNIAHRGASGTCPENTLCAFKAAVEAGAAMCELDVRLAGDGALVVIHDETVDRTTDGRGPVAELTVPQLKVLDAGARFDARFAGERIPTLDEVFAAVGTRCGLNLELKTRAAAAPLCRTIHARRAYETTIVSSFETAMLERIKAVDPAIRVGLLCDGPADGLIAQARALGAWAVNPRYDLCTAELVVEARRHGLKVLAWTVDEPALMSRLIADGVDGIMTNYPERLHALIG
ncbi:MAG TPA: glycerophosphodiester phosphodiesterase family protein [Candidatus Binataceae bacterium]|nr:glycerophosphodiester phosphodiesterase family protein [Candidatus Binataceae bacterium]HVB80019.1 glycerophosphodiester phosphodiesterase family protein [Candidatus Binataceae bacterium]